MIDSMTDSRAVDRIDEVWGDPSSWEAAGWQASRLPAVRRMFNRHVTGEDETDAITWFFRRVGRERPLPFGRVLVLACGGGELERSLIAEGRVREVVAVDISPRVIAVAEAAARDAGITDIRYQTGDMNTLDVEGPFDAVFSSSAIHHCENLEGLFAVIRRILVPGGWLFLDDYVGPDRFQWTDAQVLQINRLLQLLPDRMVHNMAGYTRRGFDRVGADVVAAHDPSEAVRSQDILRVMGDHLAVEVCRGYGGNLLHLVLSNLAQHFDPDHSGDPSGPEYLELLIEASDHLRATGRCQDDFAVAIARHASN